MVLPIQHLVVTFFSLSLNHLHIAETMRRPTHRSPSAQPVLTPLEAVRKEIMQHAQAMKDRAKGGDVFTEDELDGIKCSLLNVCPQNEEIDDEALLALLRECAHLSHKDWEVTGKNSEKLSTLLFPNGLNEGRKQIVERILNEGNWEGALAHTKSREKSQKPWAVLVTVSFGFLVSEAIVCILSQY